MPSDDRSPDTDGRDRTARTSRTTWRGRAVRAALALIAGLLAAAGPATPAQAHADFVGSSPAADSLIQDPPTQVVLTFTEAVSPVPDRVRVIAPDGSRIDRNEARPTGEQLVIPIGALTQPGTYLVSYRVISADSHPVFGTFSFSFREVSPGGPPRVDGADGGASSIVLSALPVARWIGYSGLMLLVGAGVVLTLLWPRRLGRTGPRRAAYVGAGLVALGTILELALQVPYVAGGGLGDITRSDVREVFASQFGAAHLVRLGVLGAALVLFQAVSKGRSWGADRVLLAVLGTIGIGTWSISGHPSATDVPGVSVAADMVHLGAMSVWLGGLAMLALFLLPRCTVTELAAIVPVWSRWATYAIGALILTGVAQSLLEVRPLSALFSTAYGLVLVAKVALVGVVLGVALLSRRLVAVIAGPEYDDRDHDEPDDDEPGAYEPGADESGAEPGNADASESDELRDGDDSHDDGDGEPNERERVSSARRLRTLVVVEAAVALVIIAVTSVLVQLTPARTAAETAEAGVSRVQSAVLEQPTFTLTADLLPTRIVGFYDLHLFALTPDLRPKTVVEWRVQASLPSAGIEGIEAAVATITDDHAIGTIGLPASGTWTFRFELRFDEFTNGIVTTTFTVSN